MVWTELKANQESATSRTLAEIIWNRGVKVTYLTRPSVRMMRSRGAKSRSFTALSRPLTPAMAIVRRFPRSKRRTTRQLLRKSPPLGRFSRQPPEVDEKQQSSRCFLLHRKVLQLRYFPPLTWFGGPSQAP